MKTRFFWLMLVILCSWASLCVAYPKPAIVPEPKEWTLEVVFDQPQQISVKIPNHAKKERFWYIILTLTNNSGSDVGFYPSCDLFTDTFEVVPAGIRTQQQVFKQIKLKHQGFTMPDIAKVSAEPFKRTAVPQTLPAKYVEPGKAPTQAQFSPEAAPPLPPDSPNIVVGQVIDSTGKMIEGAILEIRDSLGRPARAFKTNKAGHFRIVTPLDPGKYKVTIEKDEFDFDPLSIEAKNEIIPPIAIKAKNAKT